MAVLCAPYVKALKRTALSIRLPGTFRPPQAVVSVHPWAVSRNPWAVSRHPSHGNADPSHQFRAPREACDGKKVPICAISWHKSTFHGPHSAGFRTQNAHSQTFPIFIHMRTAKRARGKIACSVLKNRPRRTGTTQPATHTCTRTAIQRDRQPQQPCRTFNPLGAEV